MDKTNRPGKKPYRRPVLTVYGDLRTLTGGGTKASNEGAGKGMPKTKASTG